MNLQRDREQTMYDKEVISRSILSPIGSGNTYDEIRDSIIEGFEQKVRSILVLPFHAELLAQLHKQYDNGYTRIGIILNYPYGGFTTDYKVYLMKHAVRHQMDEVALGVNISAFLSGDIERFKNDIIAVKEASEGKVDLIPITWAIRIPLEKLEEMIRILLELDIHRIKTSPGVRFGAMQVEHIQFIHRVFGNQIEIEVAGRVRKRETVEAMALAGATSFHLGSWKRISGYGQDLEFNWKTKKNEECAHDRY